MFKFEKTEFNINNEMYQEYLNSLSNIFDDFLEEHILESHFYNIHVNDKVIGFFGILNKMLTQFYIKDTYYNFSQEVFNKVLEDYEVKSSFVPTCDEKFLSLSLDKHKKINMQAYFFQRVNRDIKVNFDKSLFRLATLKDKDEIIEKTEDFIDRHEERIKNKELYVLKKNNDFLGLGLITENKIMKDSNGVGMFTHPDFRQLGVGTSIIYHLANIVEEKGRRAIPGCWYYNHNSKKTLEKAGFITKTRLLHIEF